MPSNKQIRYAVCIWSHMNPEQRLCACEEGEFYNMSQDKMTDFITNWKHLLNGVKCWSNFPITAMQEIAEDYRNNQLKASYCSWLPRIVRSSSVQVEEVASVPANLRRIPGQMSNGQCIQDLLTPQQNADIARGVLARQNKAINDARAMGASEELVQSLSTGELKSWMEGQKNTLGKRKAPAPTHNDPRRVRGRTVAPSNEVPLKRIYKTGLSIASEEVVTSRGWLPFDDATTAELKKSSSKKWKSSDFERLFPFNCRGIEYSDNHILSTVEKKYPKYTRADRILYLAKCRRCFFAMGIPVTGTYSR